jgi:phosphohistidine phosphatase
MKTLTIVRHAHAEKHESDLQDFERRLDKRGKREAEAMAELARGLGLRPDHLISSPAVRAISTAKVFAAAIGFPLEKIRHDDRVYLAERATLTAILRAVPATQHHVMLVGHNPGLSRLAHWLSDDDDFGDLPTAAICSLETSLDDWSAAGGGVFERVLLRYPDDAAARP